MSKSSNGRGFSLIELMLAIGIGALVITAAGSLMVYAQNRQNLASRGAKIVELMQQVKMNLDNYNTCSANVYLLNIAQNSTAQMTSIDSYIIDPANSTAVVPTNMKKAGNLLTVGQAAEGVLVKGIRVESQTYIADNDNGSSTMPADIVVTFDPLFNGSIVEKRLPIQLTVFKTTNSVSTCASTQNTGDINAATVCQIMGRTFNPQTGSCDWNNQGVWFYGDNPDTTSCPAGYTNNPFVQWDTDRCDCQMPGNYHESRPECVQVTYQGYPQPQQSCPPIFEVGFTPATNTCTCYYTSALNTTAGWKAGISCIPAAAN